MLSTQDQVDFYILKYKEEVFKNSTNSVKNQEIIENLRAYFAKAKTADDFGLQKALNRLMSPQSLARKHLAEAGLKVNRQRGFLWNFAFISFIAATIAVLSFVILLYVVFPFLQSKFENDVTSWEFKFNSNMDFGNVETESVQGNLSIAGEKRFYIDANVLNAKVKASGNDYIYYECKYKKGEAPTSDLSQRGNEQIILTFVDFKKPPIECMFEVPEDLVLAIESETINLEVLRWKSPLHIKAYSGSIALSLDASQTYDFNTVVEQGSLDGLKSFSAATDGKLIEVRLIKGNLILKPY